VVGKKVVREVARQPDRNKRRDNISFFIDSSLGVYKTAKLDRIFLTMRIGIDMFFVRLCLKDSQRIPCKAIFIFLIQINRSISS
jgi:hypothetical protein